MYVCLPGRKVAKGKSIAILVWTDILRLKKVEMPNIVIQSEPESGNLVSPTHRPPLRPGDILVINLLGAEPTEVHNEVRRIK
jgi:hypothetical protein